MYEFIKWVLWKKLFFLMRFKGGILFLDVWFFFDFWLGYMYIFMVSYVFMREGCIKIGWGDGFGLE